MDRMLLKSKIHKRMLLHVLNSLLIVMLLLSLNSCKDQSRDVPHTLQEGDNLIGMVVTTGIADAPPLESYCYFDPDEDGMDTVDCQVPLLTKLGIGHMIGVPRGALQELDWSKVSWEVYLDGYLLDLDSFGEYTYAEPVLRTAPSPVREVFEKRKTWDIVLVNPTFGLHTLTCTAKAQAVVYHWVVNFMINATRGPQYMVDPPLNIPVALDG